MLGPVLVNEGLSLYLVVVSCSFPPVGGVNLKTEDKCNLKVLKMSTREFIAKHRFNKWISCSGGTSS